MAESEEEKAQVQMNTLRKRLKSSSLGASELNILRLGTLLPRHLCGSSFTSFSSQLRYRLIHEAFHDRPMSNNELSPCQYPRSPYLPYSVIFFSTVLFDNWYSVCLLSILLPPSPLQCKFHEEKDFVLFIYLYTHDNVWYTEGSQILFPNLMTGQHKGINRGLTPLNCVWEHRSFF